MRLAGKRVLITGAGSGIGEAGVRLFLAAGAHVVASGRDEKKLEALRSSCAAQRGRLTIMAVDLWKPIAARQVVNAAAASMGGLDCIWCNAGIMGPSQVEHIDPSDYDETLMTNLVSVMVSTGEALVHIRASGGGSIIVTSSTSGLVGAMGSPIYSASKFGVIGWIKSLAQRVAADRIRANAICPGPIATPQMLDVMQRGSGNLDGPAYSRKLLEGIPLGRLGEPGEVAEAALWLASDQSTFVTGTAIPIDGGYTCR